MRDAFPIEKGTAPPAREGRALILKPILKALILLAGIAYFACRLLLPIDTQRKAEHASPWAHIEPVPQHYPSRGSGSPFHWVPCFPNPARGTDQHKWKCGYLDTPLDYTNTSDPRTARIALVLYQPNPARKSARTIVINPGGPGGSGTALVWLTGAYKSERFGGGEMDVLGFDPRGVNMSAPGLECNTDDAYTDRWRLFAAQDPEGPEARYRAELSDAYMTATWKSCEERSGDLLRFMTTAFVARDVDRIREALGEEDLTALVYSYGTHLMAEYAALFPHRVGRMVLDGVHWAKWAQRIDTLSQGILGNVTEIWDEGIIGECVRSGPQGCALIKEGEKVTAPKLKARLEKSLEALRQRPLPATHPDTGPGVVTHEMVKFLIFRATYVPSAWPKLAVMLDELVRNQNGTLALDMFGFATDPHKNAHEGWHEWKGVHIPSVAWDSLQSTVFCSDSFPGKDGTGRWTMEEYLAYYDKAVKGYHLSAGFWFQILLRCRTFPRSLPPAEAYRGNFTAKLKHPLLFISSTYDPVTPLFNARAGAAEWGSENVRLLVHHGYGHSSFAQRSDCSDRVIRDVLLRGVWPEDAELECTADEAPYPHPEKKAQIAGERYAPAGEAWLLLDA